MCQNANTNLALIMNSRSEYIRPVIQRLTHTDLIGDGAGVRAGANPDKSMDSSAKRLCFLKL